MRINICLARFITNDLDASKKQANLIQYCILLSIVLFSNISVLSQNHPSPKTPSTAATTKNNSNKPEIQINQVALQTLKSSSNDIWFEKNEGQFGNPDVLYGFRTSFGSMGVFNNKLRVATEQTQNGQKAGRQIVDITFPGSLSNWEVLPGSISSVKGSYNNKCGTIKPLICNEITLKNVYPGIDLRLYGGENGALEFDWLLARAADHKKIRMNFNGQDGIKIDDNGDVVIDLKYEDMRIVIPETYQVIDGSKRLFNARMCTTNDNSTLKYDIAGNMEPELPLVIDPVMIWSTYLHNNTKTFDEYLYTIAVNSVSEVYACGMTNEAFSAAYMSGVTPGFSGVCILGNTASDEDQSVILYRLNPTGTAITAWTYTGQTTNIPVALGIFPDSRVLVLYQTDTIQIFSADLTTRHYSDVIASGLGDNVLSYQSQAIVDNDVFYLGGVAESALPSSIIPATAPDADIAGNEGVILRINNASTTPVAEWGTYAGGTANESFTAIAATPDKTKLAFAVHVNGSGGSTYPALVNAVDNTIAGTELLIGVIPIGTPSAFSVFSYLGGGSDEGKSSAESNAALVAADNNYFYVAGNTNSTSLPGTAGAAQPTHGANKTLSDQFLSQIPLDGNASPGFITTYNGGDDVDIVGGLVIDYRTNDVLLFGTTQSLNFPVYNGAAYSPFYQSTHGNTATGPLDITYTVFNNGLTIRKFSTYIGGDHNDYLGSTGKLQGTGHFKYNPTDGLTYIGTTIHSDQTTIPTQWMSDIPGFDKTIPAASTGKDNHFIFAMNPNTFDFGDAPTSYDAGTPANSSVSFYKIRIGNEVDAEEKENSSLAADGDDVQNFGSLDDEDGDLNLPSISIGDTEYSCAVSVFNNTGATVYLCGWIDTDGNGVFDSYEYTNVMVPSSSSPQDVMLNFTGIPPFASIAGFAYLRLRITDVTLTSADATGSFGKGEVEDHIVVQSVILPIVLQQFSATQQGSQVLLDWAVSKETSVYQYQVEFSTDNVTFRNIGTTASNGSLYYNKLHTAPIEGNNYYRLKIIGSDGRITYSPVRKIKLNAITAVSVYPNPSDGIVKVSSKGSIINQPADISLLSIDGKVVFRKNTQALLQTETLDISRYPEGQYILKIHTAGEIVIKKIAVVKSR